MIDIKLIQNSPDRVKLNNKKRGKNIDVDETIRLAEKQVGLIKSVEAIRAEANHVASSIPKASDAERDGLIKEGKSLKEQVKAMDEELSSVTRQLEELLRSYPNLLMDDVPDGGEENNEVERVVGEPTTFDFEVKDHMQLGEALGIIDSERAAKVSGSRFTYLRGDGALLQFAILQYTMNHLVSEGFEPVIPPNIVSYDAMSAMGYLERGGEEEIYHLKNDDQVLIGTSEQALGPMYMNEIIDESQLPIRMAGYSPCYRREAGSYGKDVQGILRLHQFDKIEMFSFTEPGESEKEHALILSIQEKLMQGLGLPYRVMKLAAGDTGSPSSRTWDIETWMPSQNIYRETHSTSNTTDFQTRRLNTRIKRDGKNELAHALNGTAFAIGRIIIAILENNQQADGSIAIPEALRQFMGGREFISK